MKKVLRIFIFLIPIGFVFAFLLYSGLNQGIIWFVYPSEKEYPIRGIDVSNHQGNIDWSKIPKDQFRFVYIKATEGGDFKDKSFDINWKEANANGFRVGAYHFFTLCRSGKDQAQNFVSNVPKLRSALPPVADLEFVGNCKERPPIADVKKEIKEFLDILETYYGQKPILYLTYEFIDLYLSESFFEYPIWIRDIFKHPSLSSDRNWIIWQYNSRGRVKGIDGPVDLNVFKGTDKDLEKL